MPLAELGQGGEIVDYADIPGERRRLYLVRHGPHYEIMIGEDQLMSSWDTGSEEALATLVCERLEPRAPRLLIGGLGMGFTLATALRALADSAEIIVAELVPQIVEWAHGPMARIFGSSLHDPRVSIQVRDVHDVIVEGRESFDAILLDVDNGPDGLVTPANDRLYCNWGLRAAHDALHPAGTLAVWSAYPDQDFAGRLGTAGFVVEEVVLPAAGGPHLSPYHIWLAQRPA